MTTDIPTGYLRALMNEQDAITPEVVAARTARQLAIRPPRGVPVGVRPSQGAGWRSRANCLGVEPEFFYPGPWDHLTRDQALRVCAGCVVRALCLTAALENNETFGIWGGTTERDRRGLRRRLPRWARCRGCGDRYRKLVSGQRYCSGGCRSISVKYRREVLAHPERRRSSRSRVSA